MPRHRYRALWFRVGRHLSTVIVIAFLLPYFGVSCGGQDVFTVSGADMVGGCAPTWDEPPEKELSGPVHLDSVDRQPLAILALVLFVALFASTLIARRSAAMVGGVCAIAALAVLTFLWRDMTSQLQEQADLQDHDLTAGGRFGLWCTLTILIVSSLFAFSATRQVD